MKNLLYSAVNPAFSFILGLQGKLFNIVTQAEYVLLLTQERLATGLLRSDLVYSLAAEA